MSEQLKCLRGEKLGENELTLSVGYLPKNVEPAALGKMRKIPVISWVAAGGAHLQAYHIRHPAAVTCGASGPKRARRSLTKT